MKISCINIKNCPSKSGNDYQCGLKSKVSVPAKYLLDNLISVSTTAQKSLPNSKKVLVGQLRRTHPLFSEKFFFKRPSGDVEISYDNLDGKVRQKLIFPLQVPNWLSKALFWKLFFSKEIQWTQRMKCSLDKLAESCSPEVRDFFLSDVGKGLKIYSFLFFYLSQSVSLDSLQAIMLNLQINICHCPVNFPSSSVVTYSNFFHKWKSLNSFSGQKEFRFIYPTGFSCQKSETFLQTGANCSWNFTN